MTTIFSNIWMDLLAAALFGSLGGFGLGLLQDKGLELPRWIKGEGVTFLSLGFFGDVLVGSMAAVLMLALNPPDGLLGLLSTAIPAGLGGSAILKGYLKDTAARLQANRAEMYRNAAWDASRGSDVTARLQELDQAGQQMQRRLGVW